MRNIIDNPTPKKLLEQIQSFESVEALLDAFPTLGDFVPNLEALRKDFAEIKKNSAILGVPDRFNSAFAPLGWIAYESMSFDTMTKAVELAEAGDSGSAEKILEQHYDCETLRWGILRLTGHKEFRKRLRLIELARDDYLAGRYHSCVPLLLLLVDGIVQDVSKHVGFFAASSDMTVPDSMAAHETGLAALAQLFNLGRNKTNEEPISIPYRNGILHGRDLAFDNQTVAAKCWAFLFAVRDWAGAVADARTGETVHAESELTLLDSVQKYEDVAQFRNSVDSWRPRQHSELTYLPHYGTPENLPLDSPERAVAEFLDNWCQRRFGPMADALWNVTSTSQGTRAGNAKRDFSRVTLGSFGIDEVTDHALACSHVKATLHFQKSIGERHEQVEIRLIHHDPQNNPVTRDDPNGKWCIVQNSFSNILYATPPPWSTTKQ